MAQRFLPSEHFAAKWKHLTSHKCGKTNGQSVPLQTELALASLLPQGTGRKTAGRRRQAVQPSMIPTSFSLIRTMTVGFGIAPNLLTLTRLPCQALAGFGHLVRYRRWGVSPRPENWIFRLHRRTSGCTAARAVVMLRFPIKQGAG
ncbi:hypothetical protein CES86_2360 [Brucella lupini]|uniref:Uncharacterized protein n=1 Tax=Brucella lupini TaxID=255457 RepID=A0A256GRI3_9HYPH|nr:hypothetical protein CES86_2360 [Brucella lupini]